MANTTAVRTMNGVDVDRLVQTIDAVKENPELARFQFHAEAEWIDGAQSQTRIKSIHQAGEEASGRDEPFTFEGDEPEILLGTNTAPNAVETVLHALTSCLTVGIVYNAAARGIEIKSLEFSVDGDLDLRSFLGISQEERSGYQRIRVSYHIESDASRQEIEALCEYVQSTSPVLDIIRNPVPVEVVLED
jgi:uncharacterized OsmC-like protein